MILDANDISGTEPVTADLCIVGAGAAGISMALEFADGPLDVLLLEAGGLKPEKETQNLYAGSVADEKMHSPPDRYRQRRFGGSTTIWGGRCMPLDPIDFERRDFIPNSGWPIDLEALAPFYPKANSLCEAGEYAYSVEEAFHRTLRPMIEGFASSHFTTNTLERFSCPTDFGARYGRRLRAAGNIRVLLHANVTQIQLEPTGTSVDSLTVRTLRGRTLKVKAKRYVLATGGLEVARLLLASRSIHADGVGNHHDVVGRYYMCHLAGTIGALTIDRPLGAVWNGYDVSDEGIYCRRRIALNETTQRRERVGNFVARLHHPRITDPDHRNAILSLLYLAKFIIPYEYGKRLHGDQRSTFAEWMKHVRNVVTGPFDAVGFAWHMLRDRKLAERKFPSIIIKPKANLFSLDFHAEQTPTPGSRLTLTSDVDALDMPQLRVDWRYARNDVDTIARSIALLAGDFERSGVGTFAYDAQSIEFEMIRYGAYGGHHIGTTRMGDDPRSSVVDSDCQVHGVANLSIVSSAVFPTSSQANPTLTIVALALRLSTHLRAALADRV